MKNWIYLICGVSVGVFLAFLPMMLDSNSHYPKYALFDPEMAPTKIRSEVIEGQKYLLETKQRLPEYAGDYLSCTNCHFAAGNTFGGPGNGLSLVGVSHVYPKKLKDGSSMTLGERINGCFMRSMNGKPLPLESKQMKAMIAFLDWISSGVPKLTSYPWLGIRDIRTRHIPDPENGAKLYQMHCAYCHGKEGAGEQRPEDLSYPPLWGENSFNDGAGMNRIPTFAYFVHENMPFKDPTVSYEDALDIASFVTKQPRPKYKRD